MVTLSVEQVLARTHAKSLAEVKRIAICSASLDDVSVLGELINVETISVTMNNISTLAPFAKCSHLRELYLRRNRVADLSELVHIKPLSLRVLWLSDNPICAAPDYRLKVIAACPSLEALDNETVTDDERAAAVALAEREAETEPEATKQAKEDAVSEKPLTRPPSRKKLVYAILHLLDELDEEGLRVVIAEARARLKIQVQQREKYEAAAK